MNYFFLLFILFQISFNSLSQTINYANIEKRNIVNLIGYYRVDSIKNIPVLYYSNFNFSVTLNSSNYFLSNFSGFQAVLGKSKIKTVISANLNTNNFNFNNYHQYAFFQNTIISTGYYVKRFFLSLQFNQAIPLTAYTEFKDLDILIEDSFKNYPIKGWYNYTNIGYYAGINVGYSIKQRFDIVLSYDNRINDMVYFSKVIKPNNNFSINKFRINFNYFF
ncbi:MAG: hypothetical protein KatS3mg027_1869 [Bacteroidia bacterium]|nr:MAG: hypothetical protein KatS3mg027_1869 [Bacteroidia bacterium]